MTSLRYGAALFVLMFGMATTHAQSVAPKVRFMAYGIGQTIEQRLLPSDEIVVISRLDESPVLARQQNASEVLSALVRQSDLIVAVQGCSLEPVLVEDDTWINTKATCVVDDLIGRSANKVLPSERVEMMWYGGEMVIGRVLVKAGTKPDLQPGTRYLLFLLSGTTGFQLIHVPLRIDQNRVISSTPVYPDTRFSDPLHRMPFDRMLSDIRSLMQSAK